jgi:hypothetical protein
MRFQGKKVPRGTLKIFIFTSLLMGGISCGREFHWHKPPLPPIESFVRIQPIHVDEFGRFSDVLPPPGAFTSGGFLLVEDIARDLESLKIPLVLKAISFDRAGWRVMYPDWQDLCGASGGDFVKDIEILLVIGDPECIDWAKRAAKGPRDDSAFIVDEDSYEKWMIALIGNCNIKKPLGLPYDGAFCKK